MKAKTQVRSMAGPARLALTSGFMLGFCLSAVAQDSLVSPRNASTTKSAFSQRWMSPTAATSTKHRPATPAAATNPRFPVRWEAPAFPPDRETSRIPVVLTRPYAVARDPGDSPQAVFDYLETPFAEQLRVPVASAGRGRLQLGGFYSVVTTENLLWGPPAAGNAASAFYVGAHPGLVIPRISESYGLYLSIRLKRNTEPGSGAQFWRCLKWALGAGHGCHI